MAIVLTSAEKAAKVKGELGKGLCICILGGTKFNEADSEGLVKALAKGLVEGLEAKEAYFVTGGMAGVQECFAKHCGDGSRVTHLLPEGQESGFGVGKDVHAGADLEERIAIFGQLGDLYITVEGGPGVSQEARAAHQRGAIVLPLIRTGGASGGMFEFPAPALEKPNSVAEEQWELLKNKEASIEDTAGAMVGMVKQAAKKHNQSLWEILDSMISLERGTLLKVLGAVFAVLLLIGFGLIYKEFTNGRYDLVAVYGGFLFLVFGLAASITWVISVANSLENEKAAEATEAKPATQKKAD